VASSSAFVTVALSTSLAAAAPTVPVAPTPIPLSDIQGARALKEKDAIESKSEAIGKKAAEGLPPGTLENPPGTTPPKEGDAAFNMPMPPKIDASKISPEERQNLARLPVIESTPPLGLSGWLGQTLELSVKIKQRPKGDDADRVYSAWIVNGTVFCRNEKCPIRLEGKRIKPGIHSIIYVAYNSFGSTMSRHVLRVMPGKWSPRMKFDPTQKLTIEPQPFTINQKPADKSTLHFWTTEGNAIQAFPENVTLLGSVPRNNTWEGRIKTAPRGILRLVDPKMGKWFLLNGTDVGLSTSNDTTKRYDLSIVRGIVRAQSLTKFDPTKKERVFRDDLSVSTDEATIFLDNGVDAFVLRTPPKPGWVARRKGVTDIASLPKEEQFTTRVIPVSGTVRLRLNKNAAAGNQVAEIPPGVELTLYEDGSVGQVQRPKPDLMEKLIKQTITAEEIAERERKKAEAAQRKVDLVSQLKKVEELASREDYFEMLNELAPLEDRKSEDVRIPYYLGVANRGLYQNLEAEKHFLAANSQDEDYPEAAWQLGLMYLEEKNWEKAEAMLSEARSRLNSDDKRRQEYEYYAGVSKFNLNSSFGAKNNFTRTLLWGDEVEAALKASSADFLKKLRKKWNMAVPIGVQWDGNPLSLESSDALPKGYSSRTLFRGIAGTVFTWDPSAAEDGPGSFYGGSATVMYAYHYPSSFKAFNTLILAASATQTFRKEVPAPAAPTPAPVAAKEEKTEDAEAQPAAPATPPAPTIETVKVSESLSAPLVDNKLSTISLNASVNYLDIEAGLGFDYDYSGESDAKKHAVTGKQAYTFPVWSSEGGQKFDVDLSSDQRYALKSQDAAGHSVTLSTSPSFSNPLGLLTTVKLACGLSVQKNFYGPETLTLKANPNLAVTRFLTPWLIVLGNVSYETSLQKDAAGSTSGDSKLVNKPGAGITFSGMF
jgi:tetratricopeptide (TPR) repeat protein